MRCPYCHRKSRQIKAGRNNSGSQRYQCRHCLRHYTPYPNLHGYSEEIKWQAVCMHADGMSLRRIAGHLGVNHQSVVNWVKEYADQPLLTPCSE